MKIFSLFSGIGAFEKALERLEIPVELIGFSEIDKYAVKSYCAIHNVEESKNLGDITKIDESSLPKNIDLITYGFPCQDISLAGKQQGLFNDDGTQTRSGLFFEALRIIEATQPRVAIAENVKNLTSKKFSEQFKIVLDSLDAAGYNNYWQVLNAKDYGIPQNRERVFIVSIRKDIDTGTFKFPEGFPLELRLKDLLDDDVDEKYYLSDKMKEYLETITAKNKARGNGNVYIPTDIEGISKTITTKEGSRVKDNFIEEPTVRQIGNCCPHKTRKNPNQGRLYDTNGLSPTLHSMQGGNLQPFIMVEPSIQRVDIPQTVKVRKYEVDTERLCETLRHHKSLQYLTNQDISNCLGISITKVEHWFRKDDCFAIPDAEVWMQLKALLKIETDEFDESIMTFEEKEGVYEKSERHYFADGISPTLTRTSAGNEKFIVVDSDSVKVREATKQGYAEAVEGDSINLEQPNSKTRRGRVGHGVAQTLTTSPQQGVVVNE
jgi:DNA (cytosine-5)-methyltransferase 1